MSHIRFGVVISKSAVIPRLLRYKTTLHDPQVSSTCSDWVGAFILVRREGFEPPAFWSVGCLKGKSESFRLRFVLFAAVRSADFPLSPSSPARFFRILGQNWVRHDAPVPTPTAPRSPSRRRRQQDRPRRPHRWRSPAEYR